MKKMTQEEFYKLLGILSLAAEHIAQLNSLTSAAEALTGEKDGITFDVVWSGETPQSGVDYLLAELKIERV